MALRQLLLLLLLLLPNLIRFHGRFWGHRLHVMLLLVGGGYVLLLLMLLLPLPLQPSRPTRLRTG